MQNEEMEQKIYEIGFHLVPNVAPEKIKDEFDAVKKLISDKEGTSFISEGLPTLKSLAYTLSKTVKAVKTNYDEAYFGWVKFSALPNQIEEIKNEMDKMDSVIRYLIISTVRENTMISDKEDEKEEKEEGVVPADIDKTIDELVIQ